jgi:hypothetical protein
MGPDRRDRERPLWVALALWGVPGRVGMWAFFWFSLLLAAGCVAAGFVWWPLFFGGGFVRAAAWYYAAIRWVDQFGRWE